MNAPNDVLPPIVESIRSNRRDLARLITRVVDRQAGSELAALYPYTGRAHIVGVTGAPGTGKSSLVNALAQHIRGEGQTVGIVAIDPTSPFSGGAILGDRIRMKELSGDTGVFIRSMATRGALGGLAVATSDVVRVLDVAGFDIIFVETVGAGQSEVDIAHAAQTTVVVEAPGLGDDVQAIKAGILEIADILVVNKADNPGTENTVRALRAMLDLPAAMTTVPDENTAWQPPIVQTIATNNTGVSDLAAKIAAHRVYLEETGTLEQREQSRIDIEIAERLREALFARLVDGIGSSSIRDILDKVAARSLDPDSAVRLLLEQYKLIL